MCDDDKLASGAAFATDLLAALGLGDVRNVTGLSLNVQGPTTVRLTVTQLLTRTQGAAVMALMRRKRWLMECDAELLGDRFIDDAEPDQAFDRTPTFRRVADPVPGQRNGAK